MCTDRIARALEGKSEALRRREDVSADSQSIHEPSIQYNGPGKQHIHETLNQPVGPEGNH